MLDEAHLGDIKGALGTIAHHDIAPRMGWWARLRTLLAILGPGLIVMVGDNDAGAFGTYTQAGQNYGITLLWTMLLLVPVLVAIRPPVSQMTRDFFIPNWPAHSKLSDVTLLAIVGHAATVAARKRHGQPADGAAATPDWPEDARDMWRMPPLDKLPPANLTLTRRVWMGVLRGYLLIAVALVVVKAVQMTLLK